MIYGDPRLRSAEAVQRNRRGQSALWKYGISGDLPIALARFPTDAELALFHELLRAHEYLRLKGFIVRSGRCSTSKGSSYRQELQDALQQMLDSSPERAMDRSTRRRVPAPRRPDAARGPDCCCAAAARVVMDGAQGSLEQQLVRPQTLVPVNRRRAPTRCATRRRAAAEPTSRAAAGTDPRLDAFNGTRRICRRRAASTSSTSNSGDGALPPAPWSNVVAQPAFGFARRSSGLGFTWSENSHDNRLTPWRNDPVRDPPGEVVFIRDEESRPRVVGHAAAGRAAACPTRSVTARATRPTSTPATASNRGSRCSSRRTRRSSCSSSRCATRPAAPAACRVTLYVEWVLGENRARTAAARRHRPRAGDGRCRGDERLSRRVRRPRGVRRSLSGRADGSPAIGPSSSAGTARCSSPAALGGDGAVRIASGRRSIRAARCRSRSTLDAVAGTHRRRTARRSARRRGSPRARRTVSRRAARPRQPRSRRAALLERAAPDTVQVQTPDAAMDLMLNRLAALPDPVVPDLGTLGVLSVQRRVRLPRSAAGRAGPALRVARHGARASAARGVAPVRRRATCSTGGTSPAARACARDSRTIGSGWSTRRCSTSKATGDDSVLDEQVPFLEGRLLNADEHEAYERPSRSRESASLYEHCVRAIAVSLPDRRARSAADGHRRLERRDEPGRRGRTRRERLARLVPGEPSSVRSPTSPTRAASTTAQRRIGGMPSGLAEAARTRPGTATGIAARISTTGRRWDRRRTPSARSTRSRSRGRSSPVAADRRRARARRWRRRMPTWCGGTTALILLLTPPFDKITPSPGYIQGYVPGVRENGGQYTHAALWSVLAFARLGDGDRAAELFALLNPVNHGRDAGRRSQRYRAEPYVVAADVYSQPPHTGRGGWTWYTGIRRLDVSRRRRGDSRPVARSRRAARRSVHSARRGHDTR